MKSIGFPLILQNISFLIKDKLESTKEQIEWL